MRSRIDRLERIAKRVARGGFLEAGERNDVAGKGFLDILTGVRVHLQHAADALALFLDRVHDRRALFELAGIDAGEGQRTDEGVVHDLEGEHRKRLLRRLLRGWSLLRLDVDAFDRRNFDRARQVLDNSVEKRLNALVLEGRAAEHREELNSDGALADQRADLVIVRHFAFEIGFHRGVVGLDDGLDEQFAVLLGLVLEISRDFNNVPLRAERLVAPDDGVHLDQIDNALEVVLSADRQLHDDRGCTKTGLDHRHRAIEIGAGLVHLVAEDHARDVVLVGLAPDSLGLRLNTGIGVEQRNRAVEHAQRTLDFNGEVNVAWSVDDVETAHLAVRPFQNVVVAADVIVMPRSCSCSIQSMVAAPS
jgi:hypothetical protein